MINVNIRKSSRLNRSLLGIGFILISFVWYNPAAYVLMYIMGLIGIILLFTGITGWCPMYSLMGYSSFSSNLKRISRVDLEDAVVGVSKGKVVKKKAVPKKKASPAKKVTKTVEKKATPKKTPVAKKSTKFSTKKKKK